MISEIYILSSTADILAFKNYKNRRHVSKHSRYFSQVVKSSAQIKPSEVIHGTKYIYIKKHSIFFIATSDVLSNDYDLQIIECLESLYQIIRRFCGTVSVESLRINNVLVYEILLEIIDNGIIQVLSPEKLQLLVQSDPILPRQGSSFSMNDLLNFTDNYLRSENSSKPVISASSVKECNPELFVDVLESITLLINNEGKVVRSNVKGEVVVRNYIPGQSSIKMGFNENLLIGSDAAAYNIGVHIDECLFGDSVDPGQFKSEKIIGLTMKKGETSVCKYQINKRMMQTIPLRLVHKTSRIEESPDIEILLKFVIEIPGNAELLNMNVHVPVTRATTTTMHQFTLPDNSAEFLKNERKVIWRLKRVPGNCEAAAKIRLVDAFKNEGSLLELGRVSVEFEASNFVPSGLKIRFLNVTSNQYSASSSYIPKKWIRYVSLTDSYEFNIR